MGNKHKQMKIVPEGNLSFFINRIKILYIYIYIFFFFFFSFLTVIGQQCPNFLAPGANLLEDNFSMNWEVGRCFQDDLSALHLLCILFLI